MRGRGPVIPTVGRGHVAQPGPRFPIRVHPCGRYLVSSDGVPWRLQSESAWLISTASTASEVDTYLANRKAKGFNALNVMTIVHENTDWPGWSRTNHNGDEPFTTVDHFDTPNDAYFDYIETIVDKAYGQGMVVLLWYAYAGYLGGDQGWWNVVGNGTNTQSVCFAYGQYLGRRFGRKPNVIWMTAGDYTMPVGENRTRYHKILEGIREQGSYQLCGAELNSPESLITDQGGFTFGIDPLQSDLNVNSFYGMGPVASGQTYDTANLAWANSPILPAWMQEPMYTYDTYTAIDSTRAGVRRYQHWSITAGGIAGSNWGIKGVWQWDDLAATLDDVACFDQARAYALYQSMPWWLMRPSGTAAGYCGRTLIVSGGGTGYGVISSCMSSDGSTLLAFVPHRGIGPATFSVDFRSMSGGGTCKWWDPTDGSYTSDGTFTNADSSHSFTSPATRGDGSDDWMLVCRTS